MRWRARLRAIERRFRSILGAGLLIASAFSMVGELFVVERLGGIAKSGMQGWAWALTLAFGCAFVAAQCVAAAILLSLVGPEAALTSETAGGSAASGIQDS